MNRLQNVKLFPIPLIDLNTDEGRKKLQEIKDKGPTWPYFNLEVSQETVKRGIYSVCHFVIDGKYNSPPFPDSATRVNKFKKLDKFHEMESDTLIVWAYPI